MTIPEIVGVVAVLSAFLTAVVAVIGVRWSKQVVETKDAEISGLKTQVVALKVQVSATRGPLDEEIEDLKSQLQISNTLLQNKTDEIADERRDAAAVMGRGKAIFGIEDSELEIRAIKEIVFDRMGKPIDYGDQTRAIWSFYVKAMSVIIRNAEIADQIAGECDEWIGDIAIMPLITITSLTGRDARAAELAADLIHGLKKTWRAAEADFWQSILERAKQGEAFSSIHLPADDLVQYMRANEKDEKARE